MRRGYDSHALIFHGDVTAPGNCASSSILDETRGLFRRPQINVAARYRRSSLNERERNRATDTAAGSADEGDSSSQHHRMPPLVVRASPFRHQWRWFGR
jgi:hypothetical protein